MNEQSRLVGPVPPPHRHRGNPPLRTWNRFLQIALASTAIYLGLAFLFAGILSPGDDGFGRHRHRHRHCRHGGERCWLHGVGDGGDRIANIMLDTPSVDRLEEWETYYTDGARLAGRNLSQARWTRDRWAGWGLESSIVAYDCYLSYPLDHSLALLSAKDNDNGGWHVDFEATLEEDVLEEDPATGRPDRIPTFHGYGANGNVTAPFVWVNYGTHADFEDLLAANVSLAGKIAVARYGLIFRGLKVKRAQELGMVGVVMYVDPGDDGEVTEANGYDVYPRGPARNPSSVQRGSVNFISLGGGDPTTPGYPSRPGAPRTEPRGLPSIPSLPISYAEAVPLLRALNGHGPGLDDMPPFWQHKLGLGYRGVEYSVGPTPDDVVISMSSLQNFTTAPLWDVIGVINGTGPADEVVVLGNHRDAWTLGGAGDPASGGAVLNEVARAFSEAVATGWRPRRTIVFASWDGEEIGVVGSTEWVEDNLPWLSGASVAYVNVDVAYKGPQFAVDAAPLLHELVRRVAAVVPSPNQSVPGQSLLDVWSGKIKPLGAGSDFAAFQDQAGIPSVQLAFDHPTNPYHYHSNYDSLAWMKTYGDPGFVYHRTLAQVFGLIALELADSVVIPFGARDYAQSLGSYLEALRHKMDADGAAELSSADMERLLADDAAVAQLRSRLPAGEPTGSVEDLGSALDDLATAIRQMRRAGGAVDEVARRVDAEILALPWWKFWGRWTLLRKISRLNDAYKLLERDFLYEGGLEGREQLKHVVFAPGLWTGYAGGVFPSLLESIESRDYAKAIKWAGIIQNCVNKATKRLEKY